MTDSKERDEAARQYCLKTQGTIEHFTLSTWINGAAWQAEQDKNELWRLRHNEDTNNGREEYLHDIIDDYKAKLALAVEGVKKIHEFWLNIDTPKPYFIGDTCEEILAAIGEVK